jgi:hypothetical protein
MYLCCGDRLTARSVINSGFWSKEVPPMAGTAEKSGKVKVEIRKLGAIETSAGLCSAGD